MTTVLMPLRSFRHGNTRLGGALAAPRRQALALAWAERVRRAAAGLPVVVMSGDPEVQRWAAARGARVLGDEGPDLNGSLGAAVAALRDDGVARVVVAHADLPLADDLSWVARHDGVLVVPDRRDDGTNVLAVPTGAGFRFGYGPGSVRRHLEEARRLGLAATVVADPLLAWDVDVPEDLRLPEGRRLDELRRASLGARRAAAPGLAPASPGRRRAPGAGPDPDRAA